MGLPLKLFNFLKITCIMLNLFLENMNWGPHFGNSPGAPKNLGAGPAHDYIHYHFVLLQVEKLGYC